MAAPVPVASSMWPLPTAQRAIIVGGCLAMAYTQLTLSPAAIEFARAMGATAAHIGILGALPVGMLFMQLVAAVVANHLQFRRWLWLGVSIVQRLIFVPVALGPWLLPEVSDGTWIVVLLTVTALNHGLIHFGTPLWLSWMGDYLPHDGLNRFWGLRHRWMQWTAALSLAGGALYVHSSGADIRFAFATLIVLGAFFGLADILLFLKVEEPPVKKLREPKLSRVLSEPFRDRDFRTFIGYTCFWHFAAMVGAPFISLYLLDHVGMDLYHVLMLWTCSWIGGAVCSRALGRAAEEYGHRPVLVLCTACKSLNMIALLLVPAEPTLAFWLLVPVFMIDALLNSGIAIASNGFLLKNSPAENRTMFIAAGTAWAGMVGGATSVITGIAITGMAGWQLEFAGLSLVGYHAAFFVSLLLRLFSIRLAQQIREPHARGTRHVFTQLVGVTPLRFMRFPVGFYRSTPSSELQLHTKHNRPPSEPCESAK